MLSTICAISAYGCQGASSRVRLYDWFTAVGVRPTYIGYRGTGSNRLYELVRQPGAVVRAERSLRALRVAGQTVVLSREASPLSRGGVEARLLRNAAHSVYDFDDALFADTEGPRRIIGRAAKCRRLVESANRVIAGNDYLAEWASNHGSDVRVIPSCVDPAAYDSKANWTISQEAPRLVWLGSPSTEAFVAAVAPALLEVHRRTGAVLYLISGPARDRSLEPLGPMLRRVPWAEETYPAQLAAADIGIGPVPDTPFTRGKCAYKLLQYAATGLPMVASPVGANAAALQRFDGLAATSTNDWVDALTELISESEDRRRSRAAAAMRAVREHYSFQSWAGEWLSAVAG